MATMKVSAVMGEKYRTAVSASHPFIIDQPEASGGTDQGPNPLEFFLSSLAGCICAIGRIIADQKKMGLRGIKVDIEADIDKSVLLGKKKEGRAGFTAIRAYVDIDADLSREEKEAFVWEIDSRCPVSDNIQHMTAVSFSVM